jgi:hypothetical protein
MQFPSTPPAQSSIFDTARRTRLASLGEHNDDDRHGESTSGGWAAAGRSPFSYVFAGIGARLCAGRLDAALASGVEQSSDRLLARRAVQLTSRRRRKRFADALDAGLARAHKPSPGSRAAVPVNRREVLLAQAELRRLVAQLRGNAKSPHKV